MEIKQRNYKNAISFRLLNRRVTVIDLDDDGIGLQFKRLTTEKDVESENVKIVNGKITVTSIRLSLEAAYCLGIGLADILYKKNKENGSTN